MASSDIWSTIHAERALAADVDPLTDAQWATPSLCPGWSVRDVLGHMTATTEMTAPKFFAALIASGFRFDTMIARAMRKQVEGTPADTLARFKAQVDSTTSPPGPVDTWLGETVVHAEDIRRPLGIAHTYPPDALRRVADFYTKSNVGIGGKKRAAGLTLRATDIDWSKGSGPEVTGPAASLVLAITGRKAGLDGLTGDGLPTLKERV